MAESEEELKSLLMNARGEREKAGLRHSKNGDHGIPSISSWQTDAETTETVRDFTFLGSRIPADGDCSHEKKRRWLLGRKATTSLDGVLKRSDVTLPTKVRLVKAVIFRKSCTDVRAGQRKA